MTNISVDPLPDQAMRATSSHALLKPQARRSTEKDALTARPSLESARAPPSSPPPSHEKRR